MAKYRATFEVEAVRWMGNDAESNDAVMKLGVVPVISYADGGPYLCIAQGRGEVKAKPGDYVTMTGSGQFVVLPPDQFEATHSASADSVADGLLGERNAAIRARDAMAKYADHARSILTHGGPDAIKQALLVLAVGDASGGNKARP